MLNFARLFTCLAIGASVLTLAVPSVAQEKDGVLGAIVKSLTGDVYSERVKWREMPAGNFFTEGWDEAWVSPPPGGGGAPRQGWLNSADGVFYRLGVASYGYAHDFVDNGHQHSGSLSFYLPFNRRFELRVDLPVVSNRGLTGDDYETNFGDFQLVTRFLVSETQNLTQSFNVAFRAPTGDTSNLSGVAAITPSYEF